LVTVSGTVDDRDAGDAGEFDLAVIGLGYVGLPL